VTVPPGATGQARDEPPGLRLELQVDVRAEVCVADTAPDGNVGTLLRWVSAEETANNGVEGVKWFKGRVEADTGEGEAALPIWNPA
jgi:hypothetical protein